MSIVSRIDCVSTLAVVRTQMQRTQLRAEFVKADERCSSTT
jgi:hypothetical protein